MELLLNILPIVFIVLAIVFIAFIIIALFALMRLSSKLSREEEKFWEKHSYNEQKEEREQFAKTLDKIE